jgi:N-acetylneuraminic acid mutarotase
MSYYYECPTATLLKGGKVLVTGGGDDQTRAEIYDPKTKMWSATRSMNEARIGHTATLLPNGKVLIAGGFGLDHKSDASSTAELYDPAKQSWSLTGSMAYGRAGHTALLANGRVMVAGGGVNRFSGEAIPSVEFYDATTSAWSSAASMAIGRAYHTSTLLSGGKILTAGGWGDDIPKASAELYQEHPINPVITSDLSQASFPKGKLIPRFAITTNFGAKTFSATGLPKGLTLNTKNGIISGKPTRIQTCTVTLIAKKMKGKKVDLQAKATKVIIVY